MCFFAIDAEPMCQGPQGHRTPAESGHSLETVDLFDDNEYLQRHRWSSN